MQRMLRSLKPQIQRSRLKKSRKAEEMALNTVVGLILAAMAIILIYSIIAVLFGSMMQEKGSQYDNFLVLNTELVKLFREGGDTNAVEHLAYVSEDYVVVGMSRLSLAKTSYGIEREYVKISGSCKNEEIIDKAKWKINFWSKEIDLAVNRSRLKCPFDKACVCLCRHDFENGDIDCAIDSMCILLKDEALKDINFIGFEGDGYGGKDYSCEIPLMYTNDQGWISNDQVKGVYCLRREGSDVSFEPNICKDR